MRAGLPPTLPAASPLNSSRPKGERCNDVISVLCAFHSALGSASPGWAALLAAARAHGVASALGLMRPIKQRLAD